MLTRCFRALILVALWASGLVCTEEVDEHEVCDIQLAPSSAHSFSNLLQVRKDTDHPDPVDAHQRQHEGHSEAKELKEVRREGEEKEEEGGGEKKKVEEKHHSKEKEGTTDGQQKEETKKETGEEREGTKEEEKQEEKEEEDKEREEEKEEDKEEEREEEKEKQDEEKEEEEEEKQEEAREKEEEKKEEEEERGEETEGNEDEHGEEKKAEKHGKHGGKKAHMKEGEGNEKKHIASTSLPAGHRSEEEEGAIGDSKREGNRGDVVGPGNSEKARTERAVKSEKESQAKRDDFDRRRALPPFDSPSDISLRPHVGGEPDIVQFGVLCKRLLSVDFPGKTFSADLILNFDWTDPRTATMVPEGLSSVTFDIDSVKGRMWLPNIRISNGDQNDISSIVKIDYRGRVSKVVRTKASVQADFVAGSYPFDAQTLRLRLSSSSLMSEDIILSPINDATRVGVEDDAFSASDLMPVNVKVRVVSEVDGPLRKSRGEYDIEVVRSPWAVIHSTVVPVVLICCTAWVAFFIPGAVPSFFMPRIAIVAISFLALVILLVNADRNQPPRGTSSWLDMFLEICLGLVFAALCQNIIAQYIRHTAFQEGLADSMDQEMRILFPVLCLSCWGGAYLLTDAGENQLLLMSVLRTASWVVILLHAAGCIVRMFFHLRKDAMY